MEIVSKSTKLSRFRRVRLCYPMDCSPPGSSVHGISQARILEWVAISYSRGSFPTQGSNCCLPHLGGFFTTEPQGSPSGLMFIENLLRSRHSGEIDLIFIIPWSHSYSSPCSQIQKLRNRQEVSCPTSCTRGDRRWGQASTSGTHVPAWGQQALPVKGQLVNGLGSAGT